MNGEQNQTLGSHTCAHSNQVLYTTHSVQKWPQILSPRKRVAFNTENIGTPHTYPGKWSSQTLSGEAWQSDTSNHEMLYSLRPKVGDSHVKDSQN